MQEFVTGIVTEAAQAAGLPEGRVFDAAKKDNLTQERPRIELQFLPERYARSGRTLEFRRTETEQIRKRELYTVELSVSANVLAEDREWLSAFCYAFVAALPRGANDGRGNWVKIRAERAEFGRKAPPRVGTESIEVFTRINELFSLTFIWRVTAEEAESLIPHFTINVKEFRYVDQGKDDHDG